MTKFFSHLIEIEVLEIEIEKLPVDKKRKKEIKNLIEENIYHVILEMVLLELSESDKKIFLKFLIEGNDKKIWEHLNSKVDDIENKIKKTAKDLTIELHKDLILANSK